VEISAALSETGFHPVAVHRLSPGIGSRHRVRHKGRLLGREKIERPRRRMGTQNEPPLPGTLTFRTARRTEVTSMYAAPLYGPSLRYLELLETTGALATDGTSTRIHLATEDEWTKQIVDHVESSLAVSSHFGVAVQLDMPPVDGNTLDDLSLHGLHPCFHRRAPAAIKGAFLRKFFSADSPGQRRWLTAALIRETVTQQESADSASLLRTWYTNLVATCRFPIPPNSADVLGAVPPLL
jgi:hypothetical protein